MYRIGYDILKYNTYTRYNPLSVLIMIVFIHLHVYSMKHFPAILQK